jgi:hypothetical protein
MYVCIYIGMYTIQFIGIPIYFRLVLSNVNRQLVR